jgi:putative NIF3 family GTP cyclohydrolase 1 type 2
LKLENLYRFVIEKGISKDPREKSVIAGLLKSEKERYDKLTEKEKASYDPERLLNPYADSRILNGDPGTEVKSVIVGVDMETPEILLADTLKQRGVKIDLVITHHPEGRAYANFYEVMNMHADILHKCGVPINVAESISEPRIKEVGRRVLPQNHTRAVDAARLLNLPFMSIHTPADNHVNDFLQKLFDRQKPEKLEAVVKLLEDIPEYRDACSAARGPVIFAGDKHKRAGKIFVDMTGGTEGSVESLEKLALAGVGTIIGMHMTEEHLKQAEKHHVNVVIAGHISSDNLGLNLLFDAVEKKWGKLGVTGC